MLAALAAAACTTLPSAPRLADEAGCHAWTARLDEAIAAAGVADAQAERIAGFPGLRVDRIGEALRAQARAGGAAYAAWLRRAASLDEAARAAEIANLPDAAWPIGSVASRTEARAQTDDCRLRTVRQLLAPTPPAPVAAAAAADADASAESAGSLPRLRGALLDGATVPDRYSIASRALGVYPLVRWPFFAGVQGWQEAHSAQMARWAEQPPPLQALTPALAGGAAAAPPPWPPAFDALGLPQPSDTEGAQLLAWHAPVFELERRGAFDDFGAPVWRQARAPQVDTAAPVVYQRLSHVRVNGRWLLQLVYTLWFPERPARSSIDLLAGALDGVVVRLTLSEHGEPMLLDTIHACGCYHLFFPGAALRPRAGAPRSQEWLFAPAPLPPLPPTQRLVVRLASATHYVMGVGTQPRAAATPLTYALQPEEALRSLPAPAGRRSLFGPEGLVAGTERGERFVFWPMGIASAGAMRQWGHHATAFVGRRHFDEVDLIERRFEPAPH